jgi:hypothetical protein
MQMTRYCSKEDSGYREVLAVLRDNIDNQINRREDKPLVDPKSSTDPSNMISTANTPIANRIRDAFCMTFYLSDAPDIDYFVGRKDTISSIEIKFGLFGPATQKTVVLHGLGGIGKTQTAIHFARKHQEDYTAVLWFNAKDEDTLRQSFVTNAYRLPEGAIPRYLLSSRQDADLLPNLVQAVTCWLAQPENPEWLLIFDNMDNPKISENPDQSAYNIRSYFPESPHGSIIVTTRWSSLELGKSVKIEKLIDTEEDQPSLSILIQMSGIESLADGEFVCYGHSV